MQTYRARPLDATKILTRRELAAVLNDLKRKAPRSKNTRLNLALFRLACCCGLRACEIAEENSDFHTLLAPELARDAEVAKIIAAWPSLPEPVRHAMLALVAG